VVKVKEIASGIYWLEVRLSFAGPSYFTVYFIKESPGALIEPGPASLIPEIQEAMKQLGMKDLAYIIPTHIHVDHAGAIGKLAQLFPEAKVVVHPAGVKHVVDPSRLIESTKTVFGDDFHTALGAILPVPESRLKVPEDGEIIKVGSRELQIILAPGHAPHHLAILDRKENGLFCGEALGLMSGGDKPVVLPAVAPPGFDQGLYLETMEKLRKLKANKLFYSHDGIGLEPEKLISMVAENTRYLGDFILQALKAGETPDDICSSLKKEAKSRFGLELTDNDVAMTVGGYTVYFRKKGLV